MVSLKAPLLTVENILLCVKGTGVEDKWNELAFCLHVPSTVRDEFKRNYSTSTEKLSVSLKYFLQLHPYASWRSVIVALDKMREEKIADGIRSWAEPVSDPTLSIGSVTSVALKTTMDWYDVGAMADILQVPSYIQDKVRKQYSSCEDSQKRVIMLYWMDTLYDASWSTLAGVLYYYEEETALTFCKGFLKVKQDDTLTNINLFSSLDGVTDWYSLGVWLRVPDSKQNEIKTTHKTEVQRLESLVMYYLNHHPAPSWREVAHALYRMDGGQEKNHKLLRKIYKNRFITGNTI